MRFAVYQQQISSDTLIAPLVTEKLVWNRFQSLIWTFVLATRYQKKDTQNLIRMARILAHLQVFVPICLDIANVFQTPEYFLIWNFFYNFYLIFLTSKFFWIFPFFKPSEEKTFLHLKVLLPLLLNLCVNVASRSAYVASMCAMQACLGGWLVNMFTLPRDAGCGGSSPWQVSVRGSRCVMCLA